MGTMNFGLYPMIPRYKGKFKYAWEEPYLEGSRKGMFKNTFADIEYILTTCAENNTRFEIECYDIGHLYTLRHFLDRGVVKPPLFVQSVFGILGGIGAHPEDVIMMKRTADRLLGDNYHWSVLGAGANQMRVAAMAAAMGGNVRVGMEDSLWIGAGKLAESNAQQVTQRAQDSRRARPGDRVRRRGARDPLAQGRRQGEFLIAPSRSAGWPSRHFPGSVKDFTRLELRDFAIRNVHQGHRQSGRIRKCTESALRWRLCCRRSRLRRRVLFPPPKPTRSRCVSPPAIRRASSMPA